MKIRGQIIEAHYERLFVRIKVQIQVRDGIFVEAVIVLPTPCDYFYQVGETLEISIEQYSS